MPQMHPVFAQGRLQLFVANLQDYSYRMSKLVSVQPLQFCRHGGHFQRCGTEWAGIGEGYGCGEHGGERCGGA